MMGATDTEKLDAIWRDAWTPPDRRPPWAWCEEHVKSIPYSPIPGAFSTDNAPWMREPMEALVDPEIPCVQIVAAIQASKTSAVELGLCYIIANLPGPCLWLDQTDDDAKDQTETRLLKLFDEVAPVKRLYLADRHKKKLDSIQFSNGMSLWILGAHNKTNLQRRSIRWLIGDETWRWPRGHMAEAEARTTAFGWLGKRFFVSQGGEKDDDTDKKWEESDKREWNVRCLACNHEQPHSFANVEWDTTARGDDGEWDYARVRASARWICGACGHEHEDNDRARRQLGATGRFVKTNPNAAGFTIGFHWEGVVSTSCGELAVMYLKARAEAKRGDGEALRQFYQKRRGLAWREDLEDFAMEITTSDYKVGNDWPNEGAIGSAGTIIAPPFDVSAVQIPLRFMTADVQLDCFYCLVRSWAANGNSRFRAWKRCVSWDEVEEFGRANGVSPALTFIDAGYDSYGVYRQCARRGWTALMGDNRPSFIHKNPKPGARPFYRFYAPRRRIQLGGAGSCAMFFWSNLNVKDILARLRKNQDPLEGTTWEVPADIDADYLAQMDSEARRKTKAGKWRWEQIGKRANHLWDCECMQVVAALMLKIVGREAIARAEAEKENAEAEASSVADNGAAE